MTTSFWRLAPRDPIICRDGRPFGEGLRMRSLDWPYPSVVAGCARSQIGYADGGFKDRSEAYLDKLETVEVAGPFGYFDRANPELLFPAPKDLVFSQYGSCYSVHVIRPELDPQFYNSTNANLPKGIDRVCLIPEDSGDFKPINSPFFWSHDAITKWLANEQGLLQPFGSRDFSTWPCGLYSKAAIDTRTHVAMESSSGTSGEGMLFQSSGIDLNDLNDFSHPKAMSTKSGLSENFSKLKMSLRLRGEAEQLASTDSIDEWVTLAGERRLVHVQNHQPPQGWTCDSELAEKLRTTKRVRMVLATPAVFENGWLPDWLRLNSKSQWEGSPISDVNGTVGKLRLVSAIIDRWTPVSGFSYRKPFGPKAIRRMVSAGCVYFFEVVDGELGSSLAQNCWMESVCTNPAERTAGFGLALWGLW